MKQIKNWKQKRGRWLHSAFGQELPTGRNTPTENPPQGWVLDKGQPPPHKNTLTTETETDEMQSCWTYVPKETKKTKEEEA